MVGSEWVDMDGKVFGPGGGKEADKLNIDSIIARLLEGKLWITREARWIFLGSSDGSGIQLHCRNSNWVISAI